MVPTVVGSYTLRVLATVVCLRSSASVRMRTADDTSQIVSVTVAVCNIFLPPSVRGGLRGEVVAGRAGATEEHSRSSGLALLISESREYIPSCIVFVKINGTLLI